MSTRVSVGSVLTVRCVTNFTEHTGPVRDITPSAFYADGTVREYRVTIYAPDLGRTVIGWQPLTPAEVAA